MSGKIDESVSRTLRAIAGILLVAVALFCFGFMSSHAQTVDLEDGLVAYYPFNGNANDESGNGNDGEVNGATLAVDRKGKTAKAYAFDGESSVITVTDSAGVLNLSGNVNFTMSLWALIDESSDAIYILSRNDGEGGG